MQKNNESNYDQINIKHTRDDNYGKNPEQNNFPSYEILFKLIQQQNTCLEEISKLKDYILVLKDKERNQYSDTNLDEKNIYELYKEKVNEIEQYQNINSVLQKKITNLTKSFSLHEKNTNDEYLENLDNIYSNSKIIYMSSEYIKLEENIENIICLNIEILDFPLNKYNITINNNLLKFKITNINTYLDDNDINNDNIKYNVIDDTVEFKIISGNYNINDLIDNLNNLLLLFKIKILYNDKTNYITFKKLDNNLFSLIFTNNSLFNNLGFNGNLNRYNDKLKFTGSKQINLKLDNIIYIYIENIYINKPIMLYDMNKLNNSENKIKSILFDTPIQLNEIKFKFFIKNKEYMIDPDIKINIKIKLLLSR